MDLFFRPPPRKVTRQTRQNGGRVTRFLSHWSRAPAVLAAEYLHGSGLDGFHSVDANRFHSLTGQPLEFFPDLGGGVLTFQSEQQGIELDLKEGKGGRDGDKGLFVHGSS